MAASTIISEYETNFHGDLQVNEGQLGQTVYNNISGGNVVLTPSTDFVALYTHYILTNGSGNVRNVDLPDVSITDAIVTGKAQAGWHCIIKNDASSVQNIQVRDFAGTNIQLLQPGRDAMFIAEAVNTWQVVFAPVASSTVDLQTAYDNTTPSGVPSSDIILDSTNGGIRFRDNGTPIAADLFTVSNNAGSTKYLNVTDNLVETAIDMTVNGSVVITNNLTVQGTTTSIDTDNVNVKDTHMYINDGYTTVAGRAGGLVVNYLPTATADTVAGAGFTAGVAATSNPTVATTGAATFSAGDFVQISGANDVTNDGLFEVLTHAANLLTIAGVGTTGTTFNFVQNQFTTDATVAGTITQVNVSIAQAGTDGLWEQAQGSDVSSITFVDFVRTLQDAYDGSSDGNINVDGTRGDVEVTNSTNTLAASIFSVGSTQGGADATSYLRVKNITGSSFTPALQALGGAATASGAVAIGSGSSASASNAIVLGKDAAVNASATETFFASTLNAAVTLPAAYSGRVVLGSSNAGGYELLGGTTTVGTASNSPAMQIFQGSATTVDATTLVTLITIPTDINSAYMIEWNIIGSTAANVSWAHWGVSKVTRDGTTNFTVTTGSTSNIRDQPGTNVTITGTSPNILVQVDGNNGASTINWRGNVMVTPFKFA
jgi:hypothetical protein